MKTIDEVIDNILAIDPSRIDSRAVGKQQISEMVKEIIGEQEDETSQNNPYANRRNPKLRNRLRRTQIECARERGFEV